MSKPKRGEFWRHYKGKVYSVIGVGDHTETGEQMVFYRNIGETPVQYFVRPLAMFTEEVEPGIPRFKKEEVGLNWMS